MKNDDGETGYFKRFTRFAFSRMTSSLSEGKDDLAYWRARILFAILFSGILLSVAVTIPVGILIVKERLWALGMVDGAAWVTAICLVFSRRLKYETRAAITLFMPWAIGLVIIISRGPLSGGPAWLFAFSVQVDTGRGGPGFTPKALFPRFPGGEA